MYRYKFTVDIREIPAETGDIILLGRIPKGSTIVSHRLADDHFYEVVYEHPEWFADFFAYVREHGGPMVSVTCENNDRFSIELGTDENAKTPVITTDTFRIAGE